MKFPRFYKNFKATFFNISRIFYKNRMNSGFITKLFAICKISVDINSEIWHFNLYVISSSAETFIRLVFISKTLASDVHTRIKILEIFCKKRKQI